MGYSVLTQVELEVLSCANCNMEMHLSPRFVQRRRDDHETFYCPMGHPNYFPQKSDEEKLKDEISKLKNRVRIEEEYKEEYRGKLIIEQRSKIAIKGHHTRLKKRIANGVCPCCNRSFKNLSSHMQKEHPEFSETEKE